MAVRYEALKQRKLEELDALLREQADQVTAKGPYSCDHRHDT